MPGFFADFKESMLPKKAVRVVKVLSSSQVVLNVGKNEGVLYGDQYIIFGLSEEEIIDPETNESLGKLEIFRGIGSVIYLQETMCILEALPPSILGMIVTRSNSEPSGGTFNNAHVNDYAKPNATKKSSQ